MIQIYIGKPDRLGFLNVDVYDCRTGRLKRLYLSPERLYDLIINVLTAGEKIELFRKE